MITLETTLCIHAPIERCFDLARSVEVHVAGNRYRGEEAVALGGVTAGLLGMGDRVTWRARHFGVRQHRTSEITPFDRPRYFQDRMLRGAFAFMEHDHSFTTTKDSATEMRDVFRFAAPLGWIGRIVEMLVLRRYMARLLDERNAVIREVAEGHEWQTLLSHQTR